MSVKVKPLEWIETSDRNFKALTIIGQYHIQGVTANTDYRLYFEDMEMRPRNGFYRPLDEAKAAAQADFEEAIFSVLDLSA